ncbi:hypothetical protein LK09_02660 [Microbacterium mangrovi]|uniref:LamB/YcsF family protein n=1 Tax=Microbacterium mangrovi TaxID=1348253 RepID=A0A0B2ACP4_9MICO|nr:5-oxoprolinase subunit PxpA [Microbacterium mangrovi]KHK99543.1 hypothetical protein LK09_02660 [Microbacterium mangrovi]
MHVIDLNADLGETVSTLAGTAPTADDEAMFAVISSASIACGGHAGDAVSMADAAARAARTGVAIGAHPSYVDRENFGRVRVDVDPRTLQGQLEEQFAALRSAGADIRYVKPHGALYHSAGSDPETARAVTSAVAALAADLARPVPILGLGTEIERAAGDAGIPFVREAFLDRGYLADGTLVPRGMPGDLVHHPAEAAARAVHLVETGRLIAADGTLLRVDAGSLCLHGDSPGAVETAHAVRRALDAAGIAVRAPW